MKKTAITIRGFCLILCASLCLPATAWAYPPKSADWVALGENNKALISAWQSFGANIELAPTGGNLEAIQEQLKPQMASVNAACGRIRDQIGMGGLFGPDMWTKGFAQTCWALASFQKAGAHDFAAKMCGETKDALNFFHAFKPRKWPTDYPAAEADIASFVEINNGLRKLLFESGIRDCKPIKS